ncbi:MAG: hypothetical protein K7J15_05115, partial [Candidatus Regiella insecticola]|nr:hypothetical protein [Candidatus Regiella insecticola]MCX2959796.1 hypothetical protein [Serratia symbiotica]
LAVLLIMTKQCHSNSDGSTPLLQNEPKKKCIYSLSLLRLYYYYYYYYYYERVSCSCTFFLLSVNSQMFGHEE